MTSHDLAALLLDGPNLPVCLFAEEFGYHFVVTGIKVTVAEGHARCYQPEGVRMGQDIVEVS